MERIARRHPDQLDPAQRDLYERIAHGPRASGPQLFALTDADGALNGPFGPLLIEPGLGGAVAAVGEAIRFHSSLSGRERELAILATAASSRSDFEWYAHERIARAVEVTDEEISALADGRTPTGLSDREVAVLAVCDGLLAIDAIDGSVAVTAIERLGETGAFEVACLVGYYRLLAGVMDVFGIGVPSDADPAPWHA